MICNIIEIIHNLSIKESENIIKKGILIKELSLSIERYKEQKTLKEWLNLVKHKIDLVEMKGGKGV